MVESLSNEELSAFLEELGVIEPAPQKAEPSNNESLADLLSEISKLTNSNDTVPLEEEEPEPLSFEEKVPVSPRKSWTKVGLSLTLLAAFSMGLFCGFFFRLSRDLDSQITELTHLTSKMHSLMDTIKPVGLPMEEELTEELLLEDLNPPFLEEEIIEPIDIIKNFSVA
ncbi:MAG: hypothetical protein KR126chlam2_00771 [Chlamydiae bacterium]|nr:hypothetical protein [Chlamydiota bacterium]